MTTTLKSLASSVPVVLWRGGEAGGAEQGLVADLGDVAFEDAAGEGIDGDVGGLVRGATLTMSVSSTLTSAVMTDMSARVMRVEPLGVLDADDDGLAFADGDVGDEAVEGGAADGLVE